MEPWWPSPLPLLVVPLFCKSSCRRDFFWHTCWRAAKAPARLNIKRASFTNMLYLINDRYTWNTFIFVINTKLKRHCVRNLFKSSILKFFRNVPRTETYWLVYWNLAADCALSVSQYFAKCHLIKAQSWTMSRWRRYYCIISFWIRCWDTKRSHGLHDSLWCLHTHRCACG